MKRITLLLIIVSLSSNCLFSQSNLKGKFTVDFEKAKSLYPLDSVSLRRFYFEWFPAKSDEDLKKQITQLENLISQETVKRYKEVNVKLKPLLASIIKINSLNKNQAESLVKLYLDYDLYYSKGLFSNLFLNEDNDLVYKSFEILSRECKKDTCFFSCLCALQKNAKVNAELAESMPYLIISAIQTNPIGFLEMYKHKRGEQKESFAYYIFYFDKPDEKLMDIFTHISKTSKNEEYKKLAKDLIEKVKINLAHNPDSEDL